MARPNINTLFDLCRLCVEQRGFKNIFEEKDLPHNIYICTGVKVLRSDNLPQKICMKCLDTIIKSNEFRALVADNDARMRSLFDNGSDDDTFKIAEPPDNETATSDQDDMSKFDDTGTNKNRNEIIPKKKKAMIAIRKDLFDSPTSVGSSDKISPKKNKRLSDDDSVVVKKFRRESGECVEYTCQICSKPYDTWKKLYLHQRLHNKSIQCTVDSCNKSFATKSDLEKHVRTHTGEKPYHCNICERSFTQRCTLKSHKATVHSALND